MPRVLERRRRSRAPRDRSAAASSRICSKGPGRRLEHRGAPQLPKFGTRAPPRTSDGGEEMISPPPPGRAPGACRSERDTTRNGGAPSIAEQPAARRARGVVVVFVAPIDPR